MNRERAKELSLEMELRAVQQSMYTTEDKDELYRLSTRKSELELELSELRLKLYVKPSIGVY